MDIWFMYTKIYDLPNFMLEIYNLTSRYSIGHEAIFQAIEAIFHAIQNYYFKPAASYTAESLSSARLDFWQPRMIGCTHWRFL